MHTVTRTTNLFLAICLVFSALSFLPAQPVRAAAPAANQELTSPESFLNPDGTLNLDGNFSGSFDLEGWDVTVDPLHGPVFSPQAISQGNWEALGAGNGPIQNIVYAIAVSGSDVYVGGSFYNVNNNEAADAIVKWDGTTWSALGNNGMGDGAIGGTVSAIAVDAFTGDIYAGGDFMNLNNNGTPLPAADFIARWDGSNWNALGSGSGGNGSLNNSVLAIALDEDFVYAGGGFTDVNNMGTSLPTADYIARFDKVSENWSALGNLPLNSIVRALAWGDTGLYIGGQFTNAGGLGAADFIVKWGGVDIWTALGDNGAGNGSLSGAVHAIAVSGTGATQRVIVGGGFPYVYNGSLAYLPDVSYLTFWDGADWGAMSADFQPINGSVYAITLIGTNIYVGGDFINAGGVPQADHAAKLSAGAWSALGDDGTGDGSLKSSVRALAGNGSRLYLGGFFSSVMNAGVLLPQNAFFAQWENGAWQVNTPRAGSLNWGVTCIAVNGTDVYVGGYFYELSNNGLPDPSINYIAKWDGANWSGLGSDGAGGSSLNNGVYAIAIQGNSIYVGGNFTNVNNNGTALPEADYLAKWDGADWSAVGNTALTNPVNALAVSPINGDLYVGGNFQNAGGNGAADYAAYFDGASWLSLGDNGAGDGSLTGRVNALAFQGNNLYVGGEFYNMMDGATLLVAADNIAKWDGAHWSALGSGNSTALTGPVYSLLVNGGDLYVGGNFTDVVNNTLAIPEADYLAKWDGVNWSALGSNGAGSGALTNSVYALAMTGNQLYAGGIFTNANSNAADYIAKWDGVNWSALGNNGAGNGSLQGSIYDPGVYALGISSANLYTGGNFYNVNNNGSVLSTADYIAAYGLDVTPPAVQTITRVNPTPTALTSVDFTVTFSESVTGVDLSDFTLTTSGVSNVTVSGISGTGSVYTVTVNTGSGNGTIRLDVVNDNSIKDAVLNPLAAGFTSGQSYTVSKSPVFADVPFSYWANSYIERLYYAGITGGCSTVPLNYCPDSTVTRAQMAIFLLKGVHGSSYTPPAVNGSTGFTDVSADYWAAAWIKQLAAEGITSGCGNGNYCPDSTVTRAQMAIFLMKAKNGSSYVPPAVGVSTGFADVAIDYWAAAFIKQLVVDGITSGCGNGNYCPGDSVTRAQMAVFLVKAFNLP